MYIYMYVYIYICISIIMSLTHPRSVQETPSPCTSSDSTGESGLEGGRNTGVHYSMKVKPDQELYMTEHAAICIVFTLQELYTCTHLGCKPGINRLRHIPQP